MDAGTSKRARALGLLHELDECAAKRRRLAPSPGTQPAASMAAPQVDPSPNVGLPDIHMNEEMQSLEHHQQVCLQWKAPTSRLLEGTLGSVPPLVSLRGPEPPVSLINHQMGLVCRRLMEERRRRMLEELHGVAP